MNKNPDERYKELLMEPETNYQKILQFIENESISIVALTELLDQSKDKRLFYSNLSDMLELSEDIRTASLDSLEGSISLYDLKKKKYFSLYRTFLGR